MQTVRDFFGLAWEIAICLLPWNLWRIGVCLVLGGVLLTALTIADGGGDG